MQRNLHSMAIFIEFIAGAGLAIFFHWVLHYPQAAYIIFGIGILLSLATYLIREEVEKTREELFERYSRCHQVTFALAGISEPDCLVKAQELMSASMRTITLLQQGYIPLDEIEFYLEGAKQMDQSVHQVKTVDPLTSGWDSRGALVNFYQANLRALERGVRVSRIFIGSRDDLAQPEVQKILLAQHQDNIDVRIAFREELPSITNISSRDSASSFDFAIYDDRVVTDAYSKASKYFGRKTCRPEEVAKYLRLYDLIAHGSHTVTLEEGRIVMTGEMVAYAA